MLLKSYSGIVWKHCTSCKTALESSLLFAALSLLYSLSCFWGEWGWGEWTGILLSNFVNFPDYFYFVQGSIYADMEFLTNINGFILTKPAPQAGGCGRDRMQWIEYRTSVPDCAWIYLAENGFTSLCLADEIDQNGPNLTTGSFSDWTIAIMLTHLKTECS